MFSNTKRIAKLENTVEELKNKIDQQRSYILLLNDKIVEIEKKKVEYMG